MAKTYYIRTENSRTIKDEATSLRLARQKALKYPGYLDTFIYIKNRVDYDCIGWVSWFRAEDGSNMYPVWFSNIEPVSGYYRLKSDGSLGAKI